MTNQPQDTTRRVRPWLGTIVEISASGPDAVRAVEVAFREIENIHHLMSFYEADSDVARINTAPPMEPVRISPHTYEVLTFAHTLSMRSQGQFDITVADKLVEAGFLPQPEQAEPCAQRPLFSDILLLPENHVMRRRPVWIDLGGIAKGYAVDKAVTTLRMMGMQNGIVNAGGDLRIFGELQPVHIRHPENPGQFFSLGNLTDCAVASSGGTYSEKEYNGIKIDPLVASPARLCIRWQYGVTVIAPDGMTADALTKIVRLAPSLAPRILDDYCATALIAGENGLQPFHAPRGSSIERNSKAMLV